MGRLLQGLPSWFLVVKKLMEQKNHITVPVLAIHQLRPDQFCLMTYTKGHPPVKYVKDQSSSIQEPF